MNQRVSSVYTHAKKLAQVLSSKHQTLCLAESCTGGLIAQICTTLTGSSAWFDRGYVTYSNQAKADMLGIDGRLIDQYGAVSREVVEAMAFGALKNSKTDFAIAISGIAGPNGGSDKKPIGTVYFGFARANQTTTDHQIFKGDRTAVREQSAEFALEFLVNWI